MHIFPAVAFIILNLSTYVGLSQTNTWTQVPLPAPAMCAFGDDYSIFVKPGRTDKVVIDFEGGGACWSGVTCTPNNLAFKSNIRRETAYFKDPNSWRGIFDINDLRNPIADATLIHIPYCTGDVHWGNSVRTYKRSGELPFSVHHVGAVNVSVALEWMQKNLTLKPENLRVTGCSGGAYGSIYWAPLIKKIFPGARFSQFGDSGAGVSTQEFRQKGLPQWNVTQYAPYWIPGLDPKIVDWRTLDLLDLYIGVANFHHNDTFTEFNHSNDFVQTFFYSIMGGDPRQWSRLMLESLAKIQTNTIKAHFQSTVVDGSSHCSMTSNLFYDTDVNGKKLYEWFESLNPTL